MRLQPAYRGQWRPPDHAGIPGRKRQHRSHAHDRHGLGPDVYQSQYTDVTLSLSSNGAVTNVTKNPDGSETVVTTGHNILILFPTDVPAGPTTTLYVGRV